VVKPESGENRNTFSHLGEAGSELKLIVFPEKKQSTKKLDSSSQVCPVGRRDW
jgi:preprotein translocase subunit SecE